jgi:NAD(P)-dependent dehydrogenase (short-subunit alcohol dehydrogenase family)
MGREATPQEIANFVVWLCTDEASYITGANLVIDGGMTAMLAGRME